MQLVNYKIICDCGKEHTIQVNLFTGQHKIIVVPSKSRYFEKMDIINEYKEIKGFDKIPNWDKINKGRFLKVADKLLNFFDGYSNPRELALECLADTSSAASSGGWEWTLETVLKGADRWISSKTKIRP